MLGGATAEYPQFSINNRARLSELAVHRTSGRRGLVMTCVGTSSIHSTLELARAAIEHLGRLPIPWGVRAGLATRGIPNGPIHVPPSLPRRAQMDEMATWLTRWADRNGLQLNAIWPTGQRGGPALPL